MTQASRFSFIAGSISFDFAATLRDRGVEGETDLLARPEDLDAWLDAAGLAPPGVKHKARQHHLRAAVRLREAIHRSACALIVRRRPDAADIALLNSIAAQTPLRPQITAEGVTMFAPRLIEAAMSTLAADAIRLMAGRDRARVRLCPECALLFVDNSPAGKRRWCSSAAGCGNRAKVRSFRARQRAVAGA
ncbi:MAG: ABATE domain-containing protein [Maricaulaceae bacterium]|nr:ABATE domain-containing protein [Maricaulaceae bacterium]